MPNWDRVFKGYPRAVMLKLRIVASILRPHQVRKLNTDTAHEFDFGTASYFLLGADGRLLLGPKASPAIIKAPAGSYVVEIAEEESERVMTVYGVRDVRETALPPDAERGGSRMFK